MAFLEDDKYSRTSCDLLHVGYTYQVRGSPYVLNFLFRCLIRRCFVFRVVPG